MAFGPRQRRRLELRWQVELAAVAPLGVPGPRSRRGLELR
ncbi:hypothetical protein BJY16_009196 [Actinoplanes octamycinicus]|uniref:Uncharacterized protein n=1 Tax=Actinoplanes octamycinicus TaxID=135948 RepID=A0A7W7H8E1_9ACTN|nr:hypothetical protein [Actinoplanes octamycinicus]